MKADKIMSEADSKVAQIKHFVDQMMNKTLDNRADCEDLGPVSTVALDPADPANGEGSSQIHRCWHHDR